MISELENITLYDLNEYIRRVVALNFTEPIWVKCEISQFKESRGNIYMDLIEKDDITGKTIAQSQANIWYKSFLFIKNKLGELLPAVLMEGRQVLLKVKVDYNEVYGLKLVVEDIDASYTIGQMEMEKQKVIEKLKRENLVHLNSEKRLPDVIQKIQVISSGTAAGYKDFIQQIKENEYGYDIRHMLSDVAVQGVKMENEICSALKAIESNSEDYDCIVIIRGGGSKVDLAGFDNYNIAASIAKASLPVITGIGHEIDDTISDMVAHTALKTPTAVASFVIDRNLQFESSLNSKAVEIDRIVKYIIDNQKQSIERLKAYLKILPENILKLNQIEIDNIDHKLKDLVSRKLSDVKNQLSHVEKIVEVSNPIHALKRGYSMISKNGKLVTDLNKLKPSDRIEIIGEHITVEADVSSKKENNGK